MADLARPARANTLEFPRGRTGYTRDTRATVSTALGPFQAEAILGPMERWHKSSGRNEFFPPPPYSREEKSGEIGRKKRLRSSFPRA